MIGTLNIQNNLQPTKNKLHPIKALKPTNKKITVQESNVILQAVEAFIKSLEIIDYFQEMTNNDGTMRALINRDLNDKDPCPWDEPVENIQQVFLIMCENHRSLVASKPFAQKQLLIRNSTKDICRILFKRSKLFEWVKLEFRNKKAENYYLSELIALMKELKEYQYCRLILTPAEEIDNIQVSKELLKNDKSHQKIIEKLSLEKQELLSYYNEEIRKKNTQVSKLELDFIELERKASENIAQIKKRSEILKTNEINDSMKRRAHLQQELEELRKQHIDHRIEFRNNEQKLRKERWLAIGEYEAFLRKYDQTFFNKQNKYDEIKRLYDQEMIVLNELEEHFLPLDNEYSEIMIEFNNKEAIRAEEERIFAMWTRVAFTIQAFWNGYKLRKNISKKIKKKNRNHHNKKK